MSNVASRSGAEPFAEDRRPAGNYCPPGSVYLEGPHGGNKDAAHSIVGQSGIGAGHAGARRRCAALPRRVADRARLLPARGAAGMSGRVVKLDPAAHKVADALLPWFVNGTLDGDERAFVEEHVGECALCRQEVEWLRSLHAACVAGEASSGASSAFRKLRLRLEAPRGRARGLSLRFRPRAPRWTHWVIGAQLALIAGLSTIWFQDGDQAARYRTLGAASVAGPSRGALVVVFDPGASEAELRRVLREADARVVDGPTQSNAYILDVPSGRREQALRTLRAQRSVTLAEPLDSTRGR